MKVTYYGHSSFGVEVKGKHILFDPFITPNALASSIKVGEIKADYMLLSHAHDDHVADVEAIAKRTGALVVCAYEMYVYYSEKGITTIRPMNIGGRFITPEFTVKSVQAIHSSTFVDGTSGGPPCGYVISAGDESFYYSGDTALTYDMKLIGEEFKLKFAMLPVGDNFTMGASDAIKACDFIKCNTIIGMHYNTFDIIKIDTAKEEQAFEKAGKKITFMKIGETKEF